MLATQLNRAHLGPLLAHSVVSSSSPRLFVDPTTYAWRENDGMSMTARLDASLMSLPPSPSVDAEPSYRQPVLDMRGGGMWWFWKAGVLSHLQQQQDLAAVRLHGSSSGAIAAALAACDVPLEVAAQRVAHVFAEHGVHDRVLGVLGVWGSIARRCLGELLPEDAHTRCTGRMRVRLTAWPSLRPIFLERFHSKADVIDACLASGHLPFLLDGRLAATVRGGKVMDGAFCRWASIARTPRGMRRLLRSATGYGGDESSGWDAPCHSREASGQGHCPQQATPQPAAHASSFTLDHTFDKQLAPLRLRFGAVRLRSAEGLQQLVRSGQEYGERLHARGVWAAWLGARQPMGSIAKN